MGALSPAHLVIILVIALVVLGPGKLPELGSALGKSIREFQKATGPLKDVVDPVRMLGLSGESPAQAPAAQPVQQVPMQPMPMQAVPQQVPPMYAQPTYAQPGYPQPVYAQPVYPQPMAQPVPQQVAPIMDPSNVPASDGPHS